MNRLDELKYDVIEPILRIGVDDDSINSFKEIGDSLVDLFVYVISEYNGLSECTVRHILRLIKDE